MIVCLHQLGLTETTHNNQTHYAYPLTMSMSCVSLASLPLARSASLTMQLTKPQNLVRVVLL